jgi:dTDP-4-amino-4,6-dideoxygalactose transaminase
MIVCANPRSQYLARKDEIDFAVSEVLESNQYVLGEQVANFEHNFAKFIGVNHCIGVANGTDALELALRSLDIGLNDEVITVSHTAVATVSAIQLVGATPVLVDIDEQSYTLDPAKLADAITPRTKAIIPVHLYGHACNLDLILEIANSKNIPVIEDVSQAHAGKFKERYLGTYGLISCFSCYPTKNLGAIGDAGLVCTDDQELALKIRMLREYGWKERYLSEITGRNSRLDELQASILSVKLKYLHEDTTKRIEIANLYKENLKDLPLVLPIENSDVKHVYHLFAILTDRRDELLAFLKKYNIYPGIHYPYPIHLQRGYKNLVRIKHPLLLTERVATQELSLPIYPELAHDEVLQVCEKISEFYCQ